MNWIDVKESLPKTRQDCLVVCNSKYSKKNYVTIATYIAPNTVKEEDFLSEDCSDGITTYDDKNDCYWVNEGWFEYMYESDMSWLLSDEVTHWMEKPKPPLIA